MGESALQFSDDQLDELTRTLLEDADVDNSGSVSFEELQSALSRHPGLVENLTFRLVMLHYVHRHWKHFDGWDAYDVLYS